MNVKLIKDLDVTGKKVLVRADYNVPIKDGRITDAMRVKANVPTIKALLAKGAAVICCSHMGNPKNGPDPALSLKPVAALLSDLLSLPVKMAEDVVGPSAQALAGGLKPGEVLLLENLRFEPGEKANDPVFAKALAGLADAYVSDAFGAAHRAHASVAGVTAFAPVSAAGLLMEAELKYLGGALENPARPLAAISGGAKVSSKLAVLKNLLGKVDVLIIGGAMANTFLKAQGTAVGSSLVEDDLMGAARDLMADAAARGVKILLPVDFVLGKTPADEKNAGLVDLTTGQGVPDGLAALDVGPATVKLFSEELAKAKTVVWNGPLGAFENPAFAQGSVALATNLAAMPALKIVGGGDTDALIHKAGEEILKKYDFISTGGGSFLEFMEGKELPAIKALKDHSGEHAGS